MPDYSLPLSQRRQQAQQPILLPRLMRGAHTMLNNSLVRLARRHWLISAVCGSVACFVLLQFSGSSTQTHSTTGTQHQHTDILVDAVLDAPAVSEATLARPSVAPAAVAAVAAAAVVDPVYASPDAAYAASVLRNIYRDFPSLNQQHSSSSSSSQSDSSPPPPPLINLTGFTFWSTDYHITPISDVKYLLQQLGATVIDKSLSGHCHLTNTCATDLRVLNKDNAYHMGDSSSWLLLAKQFFDSYKSDPVFRAVDAILCFHPIATCQLYMPFNKTIIAVSSTRYEHGQMQSAAQWRAFNRRIVQWAMSKKHIVAANSVYDVEYMRYFTGLSNSDGGSSSNSNKIHYLPSLTGAITARYNVTKPEFLLACGSSRACWPEMRTAIKEALARSVSNSNSNTNSNTNTIPATDIVITSTGELYPSHYEYSDLASHRCLIHLPYQVSVMSFFEQYRMNIPLLYPSLAFITSLHQKHGVLGERTWARVIGGDLTASMLRRHPNYAVALDPNDEYSTTALLYWLQYSDFLLKPHVLLYDSWDDLIVKLQTTDFAAVSAAMKQHSQSFEQQLMQKWSVLLTEAFATRPEGGRETPTDFDTAMRELWPELPI